MISLKWLPLFFAPAAALFIVWAWNKVRDLMKSQKD